VKDHKPARLSRLRGASKPHLTGAAELLVVAGNERRRNPAERREAFVEAASALLFLAIAALLPIVFDAEPPSTTTAVALILAFAAVSRVEFDVGAGYTIPTQMLFVPMLFLMDPAWAPLAVAAGLALSRIDTLFRHHNYGRQVLVSVGNAWFAIGPAVVLAAFGVNGPEWSDWPIYLVALASQFIGDTLAGAAREWLIQGVQPRLQLRMTGLVFLVDVLLTPIGFLAAIVSTDDAPLAFLLVLPLAALLRVFARERTARIDQAIELSAAYRGTAFLLGEVIVADDEYTGEHSYGVIALSLEIADELGLSEDDRRLVEFGALLHDVGKIAVPKSIVNKPGPLDDDEWAVMRQHTIAGQRMLDKVGGSMTDVGQIVRASHERWDGKGYPDGIAGEDVPLPARIVSVADTFHAITTTRPYRRAQSPEAAIKELRSCAGTQFDPDVVDALVRVLARPGATTPKEFFARTAAPEPPTLRVVRDDPDPDPDPDSDPDDVLDKALEEQLKNLF
jgi:putative nucleotidyltransferase with HDIG domain